eukprot:9969664-Alexandrium_andersonii.AAC.1
MQWASAPAMAGGLAPSPSVVNVHVGPRAAFHMHGNATPALPCPAVAPGPVVLSKRWDLPR